MEVTNFSQEQSAGNQSSSSEKEEFVSEKVVQEFQKKLEELKSAKDSNSETKRNSGEQISIRSKRKTSRNILELLGERENEAESKESTNLEKINQLALEMVTSGSDEEESENKKGSAEEIKGKV